MRVVRGMVHNIAITDLSTIEGQVLGNIVVTRGAELHLRGQCFGDLVVRQGGKAVVYRMIDGRIINEGGEIDLQCGPGEDEARH